MTSDAHKSARRGLDFDDLQSTRAYKGMQVYGRSKLANILFTTELARRLAGTGVTANCCHPGVVATGFARDGDTSGVLAFGIKLIKPFVLTPEKGARTSVYLASSPDVADVSGRYFVKCKEAEPTAAARDPEAAARLWAASEELVAGRRLTELNQASPQVGPGARPTCHPEPDRHLRPKVSAMQASQVGTTAGREGGMAIPNGAGLPDAERDVLRVVGRSWGWVLFFGIVTLVLGILVALRPESSIYFFAFVLGIWLFVSGLFRVVVAIADDDDTGGMRWLIAILGVLSVIIGILFLRHTDETLTSLAFLIGLFWVVGGMIEFFTAYGDRSMDARGFRVVMGLLAIAAGVLTLVWPGITLVVLAVVIGAWLAIYGLLEIAVSFQLRRLAKV